jgi:hypothetical protein
MPEYKTKSPEELRYEEYSVGVTQPQQQAAFGAAPFGATPAASASAFGGGFGAPRATSSAFGAQPFGAAAPAAFGAAPAASAFGAAHAAGGFGGSPWFGAQLASQPAFGAAGLFRAAAPRGGFLRFMKTFCPRPERIEAVRISSSFTPRRIFL